MIKNFYERPPESGQTRQLVILLHGLGADGRDLMGLAPLWAQHLPEAVFVSPDAPFPCDMAPMGYQWFSLKEWTAESILRGVQKAAPILDSFITEQLEKHKLEADKLALVGFSQGTMMSLYVGPRYPEKIAGILGYSGALAWEEEVKPETLHKTPIHLIHGDADQVVPVVAYEHARVVLRKYDFPVSGYITPGLMHGIDERGIGAGAEFLKSVLL